MSRDILLQLIKPDPNQPRKLFSNDKIAELAQSIAETGLIVPIMVRPVNGNFIIVHGERRYRAIKSLGLETIRAEVKDTPPEEAQMLALVENIQRANLTSIEEALAYKNQLDQGMTQTDLGKRIGKTQSYIAQKIRLLNLNDYAQDNISSGCVSEGHARQMLRIKDESIHNSIVGWIKSCSLSVKEVKIIIDCSLDSKKACGGTLKGCEDSIELADKGIALMTKIKILCGQEI